MTAQPSATLDISPTATIAATTQATATLGSDLIPTIVPLIPPMTPPPPPTSPPTVIAPSEPIVVPPPPPAEEPPPVVVQPTPVPTAEPPPEVLPSPDDPEERKDHKPGESQRYAKDKVQVKLPDGTEADEVTFKIKQSKRLRKGEQGQFLVFDIKARNKKNKKAVEQFDAGVDITTTLKGFVDNIAMLPDSQRVFVAYLNEKTGAWEELPVAEFDHGFGTLHFKTKHFSTYGLGVTGSSPNAWMPSFTDASIDRFSGGFSWSYGFPLPAGQGGKAPPGLALSYSSRSVDGLTTYGQPDGVGYGWNIDSGEIMWSGVRASLEYGTVRLIWNPRLTLALNGKTYKLSPQGQGAAYPSDAFDRLNVWQYQNHFNVDFKAESDDYLRARWLDQAGGQNGYFEVTSKDGTKYIFGNTDDSRVLVRGAYWRSIWDRNPGNGDGTVQTVRWRLKQIIYPTGAGSVNYTYTKQKYWEQCNLFVGYSCSTPGYMDNSTERASYIKQIDYPGARVVFNWDRRWNGNGPDDGRLQQAWDQNADWALFWQTDALQSLEVQRQKYDGNYGLVNKWQFIYGSSGSQRVLQQIKPLGADGTTQLPGITFGHTAFDNKDSGGTDPWSQARYPYPRINSIANGYGATINVNYETCDTGYWHTWNYRVTNQTVSDGMGGGSKLVLTYPDPVDNAERLYADKYDTPMWPSDFVNNWGKACGVGSRSDIQALFKTGGTLVGYRTVTATLQSVDGSITLRRERDSFVLLPSASKDKNLIGWLARGRPLQHQVLPATGNSVLRQDDSSYSAVSTGTTLNVNNFIRLDWQTSTQDNLTTKVEYAYDGYGNPKAVVEHGNVAVSGDERTTLTGYYPNAGAWIVGLPAWSKVYAGAYMQSNGDANYTNPSGWATETRNTYDGNSDYTGQPSMGRIAKISKGDPYTPPWYSPAFAEESLGYDSIGNVTVYTDARSNRTQMEYINGIYLSASVNALGHRTEASYACIGTAACPAGQPVGALLKMRDAANNTETTFTYDVFGRLKTVAKPLDSDAIPTQQYIYGDTGLSYVTPPLKIEAQQRESAGCAGCVIQSFSFYDGMGRVAQTRAEAAVGQQRVVNMLYDAAGRVVRQFVPVYETSGNYNRPAGWNTRPSSFTVYDTLGRTTSANGPDGVATTMAYGSDNNRALTVVTNALGVPKRSLSDGLGRMVQVQECGSTLPCGWQTTNYTYDVLGQLKTVTDAGTPTANTTSIYYDALGRKTSMTDPDMGAWSYGYDANGNLISQTDANLKTLYFNYDALNRLTEKRITDTNWGNATNKLADFVYDEPAGYGFAKGRRTRAQAYANGVQTSQVRSAYDERGRNTWDVRTVDGIDYATVYAFDSADRVTSMTYPDNEVVYTNYDAVGQPLSLQSNWGTTAANSTGLVNSASYNALGQPTVFNLNNTLSQRWYYFGSNLNAAHVQNGNANWSYGKLRQNCVALTTNGDCFDWNVRAGGSSNTKLNLYYNYDTVGNVKEVFDRDSNSVTTQNRYDYDALDRLTAWSMNNVGQETYAYNAIGNITNKSNVGTYDYDVNATNDWGCGGKPHSPKRAGSLGYCYDANGNMEWRYEVSKLYKQTWNADNKIASIQEKSTADWATNIGSAISFSYDADGARVKSVMNGVTTVYIGNYYEVKDTPNNYVNVTFAKTVGVNVTGNTLTRNDGVSNWGGSGASSTAYCMGGICAAYASAAATNTDSMYGLSNADTDASYASIRYGLHLQSTGNVLIYESGAWKANVGSYAVGDRFTVQVDSDNKVRYYRFPAAGGGWQLLYTSTDIPTYPLRMDSAIYSNGGKLVNMQIYGTQLKTTTSYYYFGGQRVAMRTPVDGVQWLHSDHLGSSSMTTNYVGGTVASVRYKPFGEVRTTSGALATNRKFGGKLDDGFGLLDFSARQYSTILGRFISPDSIIPRPGDPQSLNRYSFVVNNPLSRIDSSGHDDEPFWKKACRFFGFCQPPPNMAPEQGASLNVNDGTVEVKAGPDGMLYASRGDKIKGKTASIGGGLLALLARALGGGPGGDGADKAKKLVESACGGDCSDEAKAAGELHHVFSNKIMAQLSQHSLGKLIDRDSLLFRAVDATSHKGYQAWHRAMDSNVVKWLQDSKNVDATLAEFLDFLKAEYLKYQDKFSPEAIKLLETLQKQAEKEGK